MNTLLWVVVASAVFGALWWLLSRVGAPLFVVAAVSFAGGVLVLISNGVRM
jgi:hypothetical protein